LGGFAAHDDDAAGAAWQDTMPQSDPTLDVRACKKYDSPI
jgi:hypothetical protein